MNHIYCSVWNEALGAWVAVSELTKGQSKRSANRRKLLATSLLICATPSWALPTGNELVAGQATVTTPNAGQMQINQASQKAVINWQGFSINANEAVNIQQPNAQAALLNRVVGQDASQIQGQLNANGQVYLVNPNGVVFGKTAQVDVGGLVAGTHDISTADFMNGKNHFSQNGATGNVENHGTINAKDGGVVALIGEQVTNTGTINTPKGTTALAAGKTIDLDFQGDGLVEVKVTESALNAQITNRGAIQADGGRVIMSAKAANSLIDTVINQEGVVRAQGLVERNGEIILDGGDNDTVKVNGTIDAQGTQGGKVSVTGKEIQLTSAAIVDASGTKGGGQVVIGDKQNTAQTTLATSSKINVSTKDSGTSGKVEVFANMDKGQVNVSGIIDASAPKQGDGGFVETSAAKVNVANTAKITTQAQQGKTGTWLIDPVDFTIAPGSGLLTTSGIGADTLSSNLGSSNVTIATNGATAGNGDIFVNSAVSWLANTLTLSAHRNININANLNASGTARLALLYGQASTTGGATDDYFLNNGAKVYLPAGLNFSTQKGSTGAVVNYQVITSLGLENSITAADLQGMNGNLAGNYVLGTDIDASLTSGWNAGAGFLPVGNAGTPFRGRFDGLNHTITGLTINRPITDFVGLFGYTNRSPIRNVGLLGGSTRGRDYVGRLVGISDTRSALSNVYATGSVWGRNYVGGLAGYNYQSVISNAYATGAVNGTNYVGGLVGINEATGTLSNVYATGAVSGITYVGGLVGENLSGSTISNAYATGAVSGTSYRGGLAGFNGSAITNSLWDTVTSTQANAASTLSTGTLTNVTGRTTAQMMTQSTFTGWNIANTGGSSAVWRIYEGQTTPWLRSFLTPLSVTADSSTISYNGLNNTLSTVSYTNTLTNAAITPDANLLGTVSMLGAAGKNSGSYTFTPTGLYANQQGYDVSFVNGTLTINPLALNLAASRTYDGTVNFDTTTFGTAGTINTGIGTETLVIGGTNGTVGSANAGAAQSLTTGGLILTDGTGLASNYSFGTLTGTINKAPLIITALAADKTYDGLAYSGGNGVSYSPFVNGENSTVLGGSLAYGGTSQGAVNAGSYAITPGGLTGNNYDISYVDGNLIINKANARVIANNASKTQGQTLNFTGLEFIASGLVNGETIGSVNLTSLGAAATASAAGSPYAITASNATGGNFNLNNYNLSYADGKLTVNSVAVPPVIPVIKPPVISIVIPPPIIIVIKPPVIPTAPIEIDNKETVQVIKPVVIQIKVNSIDSELWLSQLTPLQISTTFLHDYQQALNDFEEIDPDFGQYKRDNLLFSYEQRRELGKRKWSEKRSKPFNNRYTNMLIGIVNGGMKLPKLIVRN